MSTAFPQTGRSENQGTVSGPRPGTYVVIPVTVGGELAATVYPGAATFIKYVPLHFACRVMEVSFMAEVTATVGAHTWAVQNGGAAGSGTTDIVAANSVPASATVETFAAAALTNRNCAKGDILRFRLAGTNAGDITTRGVITVTVWVRGHVVANPNDD